MSQVHTLKELGEDVVRAYNQRDDVAFDAAVRALIDRLSLLQHRLDQDPAAFSTLDIQQREQAHGPHRPTVALLTEILSLLPAHHEVMGVAVNGQTGKVMVQLRHEGMEYVKASVGVP